MKILKKKHWNQLQIAIKDEKIVNDNITFEAIQDDNTVNHDIMIEEITEIITIKDDIDSNIFLD